MIQSQRLIKPLILAIVALFLISGVYGTIYVNMSAQGDYPGSGDIDGSKPIDPQLVTLQESNAQGETQLTTAEQIYQLKKNFLIEKASDAWDIIIGLFMLVKDTIILLVFFFEMRIILYVFVELIPSVFIKIRDRLTGWYVERYTK